MAEHCPCCGAEVTVYSGDEGTSSYNVVATRKLGELESTLEAERTRAERAEADLHAVLPLLKRYIVERPSEDDARRAEALARKRGWLTDEGWIWEKAERERDGAEAEADYWRTTATAERVKALEEALRQLKTGMEAGRSGERSWLEIVDDALEGAA